MDARQIKGRRVESESEDEKEERYAPISGRFSLMISSFFTIPFKHQHLRVQQRFLECPPMLNERRRTKFVFLWPLARNCGEKMNHNLWGFGRMRFHMNVKWA